MNNRKKDGPIWKHLVGHSYAVAALCGGLAFLASVETGLVFLVAYAGAILLFSPYFVLEYFLEWDPAESLKFSGRLYVNTFAIILGIFLPVVDLLGLETGPHQSLEWFVSFLTATFCALTIPSPMQRREIRR